MANHTWPKDPAPRSQSDPSGRLQILISERSISRPTYASNSSVRTLVIIESSGVQIQRRWRTMLVMLAVALILLKARPSGAARATDTSPFRDDRSAAALPKPSNMSAKQQISNAHDGHLQRLQWHQCAGKTCF